MLGGSRVASALPRASRRPGGRRSARRRTIPRRRSAAPPWCRLCPFVGCGLAAMPALRSPWGWCWPVAAASGAAAFFFSRGLGSSSVQKKERNLSPVRLLRAKRKNPLCPSVADSPPSRAYPRPRHPAHRSDRPGADALGKRPWPRRQGLAPALARLCLCWPCKRGHPGRRLSGRQHTGLGPAQTGRECGRVSGQA